MDARQRTQGRYYQCGSSAGLIECRVPFLFSHVPGWILDSFGFDDVSADMHTRLDFSREGFVVFAWQSFSIPATYRYILSSIP